VRPKAVLVGSYGLACYALFVCTLAYGIAFVADLPVPRTVNRGPAAPAMQAVIVNVLLFAAFGLQHSVMARGGFKRAWTRVVPPAIERSTYVLASSLAFGALMAFWHPIVQPLIWVVDHPQAALLLQALSWVGWLLVVASSFLINHFEMLGLRQVAARVFGWPVPATEFRTPLLYRHVRHPLYLGFLLAFWATPRMTAGHLLFAAAGTAYILVGVHFEERDLVTLFGERYRAYQRQVGKLLPRWRFSRFPRSRSRTPPA
jgi:protein-S-isoprenylcysteine O-methyltransferase Ste14